MSSRFQLAAMDRARVGHVVPWIAVEVLAIRQFVPSAACSEWGGLMSAINGDKARFGRQRKEKIQRRIRIREMRKTLEGKAPKSNPAQAGVQLDKGRGAG